MNTVYLKSEGLDYDIYRQIKIYFGKEEKKKNIIKNYVTNKISTTKYNFFTFLPKSIMFQFRRIANVYFLIISILTFMSFSPKNPLSMISTFLIVILFTMIKEAYEVINIYIV
jgi:phospholipid-transporting ATPase